MLAHEAACPLWVACPKCDARPHRRCTLAGVLIPAAAARRVPMLHVHAERVEALALWLSRHVLAAAPHRARG